MTLNSHQLLAELQELTNQHLDLALQFSERSLNALQSRPSEGAWNALECLEHLNRYGHFYLPEIRKQLQAATSLPADQFNPGMLGNYFANSMRPSSSMKKIKTFKKMNPVNADLNKSVIDKFVQQQRELLNLLELAKKKDLNTTRTAITISKLIRLKMGDTLRFLIYHNQRHIEQAARAVTSSSIAI